MSASIISFDPDDHTVRIDLGTGNELHLRHTSDQQISVMRAANGTVENAQDTTGDFVTGGN